MGITTADLEEKLNKLERKVEVERKYNPVEYKDRTRSKIALFVVREYFTLVAVILIGVPIYNIFVRQELVLSVSDLLSTLSGILSGTFGFVVGYYFKGAEEAQQ